MTILILAALLMSPGPCVAQADWISGFYQNVPLVNEKTGLSPGGLSDFNRIRFWAEPDFGKLSIESAYEQVLTLREHDTVGSLFVGSVPSGGEWLDLQWTISDQDHVLWQHRFDRLLLNWRPTDQSEISAGRQAVSWGTTLFLTPADPFAPFNPADPFRVFRAGVDSGRIRFYPSALSEVDVVVRPTSNEHTGEETTVLGRGLATVGGWEVSGWAGSLYGDAVGALAAAGDVTGLAIRGEAVLREVGSEAVFRGTIGVDRQLAVNGRDLYFVLEYQHDGLGAANSSDYGDLFRSDPFLRGELQVLGRDECAIQVAYQVHPLWSVAAMWLWNFNDASTLLSPNFAYSAGDEVSISGGLYFGFGDDGVTESRPLPSEYGLAGATAYASASLYF